MAGPRLGLGVIGDGINRRRGRRIDATVTWGDLRASN